MTLAEREEISRGLRAKISLRSIAEAINACKQMLYESIDKPIHEALKAEAYLRRGQGLTRWL